jgi:hypothetical protein
MNLSSDWTPLPDQLHQRLKQHLGPIEGQYQPASIPNAEQKPLSFYPKASLIRLHGRQHWRALLPIYFVATEQKIYPLDGRAMSIGQINDDVPITLNQGNITDYLKFFCFFVHGDEGPFLILDNERVLNFIEIADTKTKKLIENEIRPSRFKEKLDTGTYLCDATVFYGDVVFSADFAIDPNGDLRMLDDEKIAGDLKAKPNAQL